LGVDDIQGVSPITHVVSQILVLLEKPDQGKRGGGKEKPREKHHDASLAEAAAQQ